MDRPLYIAIEGPIGVGKTTLVRRISERMRARVVLEVVEENPFLPKFYQDRARFAFQTQVFFLMSRFPQQQALLQADLFTPNIIADYHLLKDRIFARLTLEDEELALYERVYKSLEEQVLKPDVLIYLHAPIPVLLDRIRQRDRPFERNFDETYLTDLAKAYQVFFAHYSGTPLLTLDNSEMNYADDGPEAVSVMDRIFDDILRLAQRSEPPSQEVTHL